MSLFKPAEWSFTKKALDLVKSNPFEPNWRKREAEILNLSHRDMPEELTWYPGAQLWGPHAVYAEEFDRRIAELVDRLRRSLEGGEPASEAELERYELLSIYRLYCEYGRAMDLWIAAAVRGEGEESDVEPSPTEDQQTLWAKFHCKHDNLLRFNSRKFPLKYTPEHLFACFFLFRRAFYHIFFNIVGTSKPIAKLRSAVWESIVTHDFLGWMAEEQGLYQRMKDIPTLITGPSGTGKERAAEAIGRSLYIPFKNGAFATDFVEAFNPVNLAALPPSLIEAELFGQVKGAFTDAKARIGRLEACPKDGAVFLDEIGEVTQDVQVKLLRALNERRFERVGENKPKVFHGKIIAATNRDLVAAMQAGRFREDFYYRLCADKIETPSLREQLDDRPDDLSLMVGHACRTVVGEKKATDLAREVVGWIERNLPGHPWPGNFRELAQCVRSYTIRKTYHPVQTARPRTDDGPPRPPCDPVAEACEALADAMLEEKTTFKEIKRRLFTLVRRGAHTDKEAARRLGLRDYRTVQAHAKATNGRS